MRKALPKKSEWLAKQEDAPVPDISAPGPLFALTGALGEWFEPANADVLMKYIERSPAEFQIVTMRNIVRRQGLKVLSNPSVSAWMKANSDKFVG